MSRWSLLIFRSVGQRSRSKVMLGKGGISVSQTSIFSQCTSLALKFSSDLKTSNVKRSRTGVSLDITHQSLPTYEIDIPVNVYLTHEYRYRNMKELSVIAFPQCTYTQTYIWPWNGKWKVNNTGCKWVVFIKTFISSMKEELSSVVFLQRTQKQIWFWPWKLKCLRSTTKVMMNRARQDLHVMYERVHHQ